MTAAVIPFPAVSREGKIRHVASVLRRKHGRDADRYWRQTILVMRAQMQHAGIDPSTIDQELRAFAREVFARVPEPISDPRSIA